MKPIAIVQSINIAIMLIFLLFTGLVLKDLGFMRPPVALLAGFNLVFIVIFAFDRNRPFVKAFAIGFLLTAVVTTALFLLPAYL